MSTDLFLLGPQRRRNTAVVAGIALAHGAALWALQGPLNHQRPQEIIVPIVLLSEFITPPTSPAPLAPSPPPRILTPPVPTPQPAPKPKRAPAHAPRPPATPITAASPEPSIVSAPAPANAQSVLQEVPEQRTPLASPSPPLPPSPSAPPAPPRIELPSSHAGYLNNPSPAYPSLSKRMGEQGKVMLRVLISADGRPERVEIRQSSGFDRLDRQAYDTVLRWRFVPGTRNGVAEAMWYLVPINFVLE